MEPIVNDSASDKPDDELTAKDVLDRYKMEIQLYEKEYKPWEVRGTKIIKRYRDERSANQTNPTRFNILYSNVQTLQPAAYGKSPKPDIQRRFKDDDALSRVTSDVLERATSFFVNDKFDNIVRHCLQDRLLPGRGIAWVRYEPHMRDIQQPEGVSVTNTIYQDEDGQPLQEVYFEEVCHDYVYWKDFGHNVTRTWDEVYLVWRKAFLTKDDLESRFGEKIAEDCPMDYSPRGLSDDKKQEILKKSTIYECWDKKKGKVYWVHRELDRFLDVKDDPLHLPDFFPCPKPLLSVTTNESLIPVPDYAEYQDQAMELDEITSRISSITKSIKVVGVYDSSAAGVERMLNEGVENKLIAVEAWAMFAEKGGLQGAVQFMPIKEIAEVLLSLYEAREKVKQDLYEITGIADIIRGATKASETATAQNIKSQFATLRLDQLQHAVARFSREMVYHTALVIANHFSLDTIKQISGVKLFTAQEKQQFQQQNQMAAQQAQATQQPPAPIDDQMQEMLDNPTWEEVEQLLRNQPHLNFAIDIETDSTIKMDEQQDQEARMQLLESAGSFIQQATMVIEQQPQMTPLFVQMLLFGVRGFKVGKSIEGTFRTVLGKIEKQSQQPQPPKPDPAMEKIKSDQQSDAANLQADKERDAAKLQADKEKNTLQLQADADRAKLDAAVELIKHDKTLQSQKEIASMTNEANSKPTTQIQISGEDAIKKAAESIEGLAGQGAAAIAQALAAIPEALNSIQQGQAAILQGMSATKEVTLDNGRKATIRPRVD